MKVSFIIFALAVSNIFNSKNITDSDRGGSKFDLLSLPTWDNWDKTWTYKAIYVNPKSKVAGPQSKVLSLVLLILKLIFFRTTILILHSSIPQP